MQKLKYFISIVSVLLVSILFAACGSEKQADLNTTITNFQDEDVDFEQAVIIYKEILAEIDNGTISPVDGYNKLDALKDSTIKLHGNIGTMKVADKYKDDKNELGTIVAYLQSSVDNTKNFLDSHKTSDLAAAQKDLQTALSANENLKKKIMQQATDGGYKSPDGAPIFK